MGSVVSDFLVKHFPSIVDYNFTANVEEEFDNIAEGKLQWQVMIERFYNPFHLTITNADDIRRDETVQSRELGIDPKSGKMVYARIGRFGPMFQLGENDDTIKPKFASLTKGMRIDQVTLKDALKLFELPRLVGTASDGQEVTAQIGRFGPYLKHGPTFASISQDEIFSITIEEAEARINEKKASSTAASIKEFAENDKIKVKKGRFGPYVTDGSVNAKIPKGTAPESLTLNECIALIENSSGKKKPAARTRTTKQK
jgi:DNA topoisomerase-1